MGFLRGLRASLIDRYIVREIVPPAFTGLVLFTFILLLKQIPDLLQIMISRSASGATTLKALAHLLPSMVTLTLPMGFLLGVLFAFGRMSSDSEIIAMRASGFSAARLLRPVLVLSIIATSLTFYVYSVLTPVSNQAYRQLVMSLLQSSVRQAMKPGVFNEDLLSSRSLVIYARDIAPDTGLWRDVFISDRRIADKPRIMVAKRGHLSVDEAAGKVALNLEEGAVHSYIRESGNYDSMAFHQKGYFPLATEEIFGQTEISKGERELTIPEISRRLAEKRLAGATPKERARLEVEWQKRFAIPVACLVFGIIGLALSLGPRREARSAAFGVSVVVIAVYYILLQVGIQLGNERVIAPAISVWIANVVLGGAAVLLLYLNQREAAFDPLDVTRLRAVLPGIRRLVRRTGPEVEAPAVATGSGVTFPGLLDRYIARLFVRNILLVLASFCVVYVIGDLMDLIDDIHQNRVRGIVVLRYYLFYMAAIVHLVTPVAVLVAVLVTFGVLARRNEITAMKSIGVSVYRAVAPTLALAVVGSILLWTMTEYVLPPANLRASLERNEIKGRPRMTSTYLDRRWTTAPDGRFYNYDYVSEEGAHTFHGLSVYEMNPKTWTLRDHLHAETARWDGFTYQVDRGFRWIRAADRVYSLNNVRTRNIEAPTFLQRQQPPSETLRYGELRDHIASLKSLGLDSTKQEVQLHRKVAFPFVAVVMTLLAVPFAFTVARRGALYGVFLSIVVALAYWACLGIFDALGNNALIPPLLAAWAPNLLFSAAGAYLMLGLET